MRGERAREPLPSRVALHARELGFLPELSASDPRPLALLNAYRRSFGLPTGAHNTDGATWHGFEQDGRVVVAFSDRVEDRTLYVQNVCPAHGRWGTIGVYAALMYYRALADCGLYDRIVCTTLVGNLRMKRALQLAYGEAGAVPVGEVYAYARKAGT